MSEGQNQPLGGTAIKPEGWDRTGFEAFRYMLYDPKTKKILTRTPMSWLKIFVFYCIYYSCLAAFWLACLNIFFLISVDDNRPTYTLKNSLIGANPGVGLRPRTTDKRIDSSLYYINLTDSATEPTNKFGEGDLNADTARRAKLFLDSYTDAEKSKGLQDCSTLPQEKKRDCLFDTSVLEDCAVHPYGFFPQGGTAQPCFFIKLNKIYAFKPNTTDEKFIDTWDIKDTLKKEMRDNGPDNAYFECRGRYPADNEGADNADIGLQYFPKSQAVSLDYFPFRGGNYHSPLVAVRVTNPPIGRLVHLECRVYYSGVEHNTKDKVGLVQFELLIE